MDTSNSGGSQSATAKDTSASARDWPEDFAHENGRYMCYCVVCHDQFLGHKRRVVCRTCDWRASVPDFPEIPYVGLGEPWALGVIGAGVSLMAICGMIGLVYLGINHPKNFDDALDDMRAARAQWMLECREPAAACAKAWEDSLPPLSPFRGIVE